MRAGTLRHMATVYSVGSSVDSWGDATEQLTPIASSVPCSLVPMSGREWHWAKAAQSEHMLRVRMRFIPGLTITPKMRVEVDGTTYNIESVSNIGSMDREIELMVSGEHGAT